MDFFAVQEDAIRAAVEASPYLQVDCDRCYETKNNKDGKMLFKYNKEKTECIMEWVCYGCLKK